MTEEFRGVAGKTVQDSTPWWPAPVAAPAGAPNIVLIVLDDVGFADLGCFGSEIDTRNIDALASGGLRYNNFHTTALCSPTRACLLTGRNHHSVGMGVVSNWDTGFPGYRGRVSHRAATVAEMLRPEGYNTFAVGKWHLTPTDETTAAGPFDQWPTQRGFDRFYGFLDGATDQYSPDLVVDNHRIDAPRHDGYHLAEDLVDQSIGLLRDQRSAYPEKPFLLYLSFGTAHYPLHAPEAHIEKYRGRYDVGWDVVRDERLARQKEMGIVPPDTSLAPRNDGVAAWTDLAPAEQRIAARLQEVYAGMIDHTDAQVGRLVEELVRLDVRDDTLVLFLSDNGATLEGGPLGSLNYMRYVNGLPMGDAQELTESLHQIGGPLTSPMYPMGWGMASNTPLKRYKQNTHGGGIRDPLIVSWPARIREPGIRNQYLHAIDIVPTLLDITGIAAPDTFAGTAQLPIEGVSIAATFDDASAPTAKAVQYFEMLGNRAVWRDGWKAVAYHPRATDFDDDRWELYHVDADFAECHDLAETHPDKVQELVELWWIEAARHQVLPLDDRIMERFLVPKPRPITSRSRFVYYDGAHIPSDGTPDIKNVSYSITVELERGYEGADGTILSCGDRFCGYALHIVDGTLVHDYNCAGTHYVVRSDIAVPTGPCRLRYEFAKDGELRGVGSLSIDGRLVGQTDIPRTLGVHVSPTGLTIGRSPVSPVGSGYDAPFRFAGRIDRVVFDIGDDRAPAGPTSITAVHD